MRQYTNTGKDKKRIMSGFYMQSLSRSYRNAASHLRWSRLSISIFTDTNKSGTTDIFLKTKLEVFRKHHAPYRVTQDHWVNVSWWSKFISTESAWLKEQHTKYNRQQHQVTYHLSSLASWASVMIGGYMVLSHNDLKCSGAWSSVSYHSPFLLINCGQYNNLPAINLSLTFTTPVTVVFSKEDVCTNDAF